MIAALSSGDNSTCTVESPRLSPIRSLAYFTPVVEELTANPLPDGYLEYLRYKMRKMGAQDVKG